MNKTYFLYKIKNLNLLYKNKIKTKAITKVIYIDKCKI